MNKWPPAIKEMGDIIKDYIDRGEPLSISSGDGVYNELETKFAELHGRKYGLVVSSGTMALFTAFFAIGLKPGDEVISTSFSFHATASPLLFFGVKIVFCDVEDDTGNIDIDCIKELITINTRAIVTNDQWGHPCDKQGVQSACKEYGLLYIEDCSHAHFSEYNQKYVGTFGDIACWSFQGSKLLSGGEGGIILTDNYDFYEKSVLIGHYSNRSKDTIKNEHYRPLELTGYGLKLRMHPLAAVIVLHQLNNYCFQWIKSRSETLTYFENKLNKETPIKPMVKRKYTTSMGAWYGFYPRLDFEKNKIDKHHICNWLTNNNLKVNMITNSILPQLDIFNNPKYSINGFEKLISNKKFPNAKKYMDSLIGFPRFTFHEYEEIDHYVSVIKKYFEDFY